MLPKKRKNAQILLKSQESAQECWKCKIFSFGWKRSKLQIEFVSLYILFNFLFFRNIYLFIYLFLSDHAIILIYSKDAFYLFLLYNKEAFLTRCVSTIYIL